MFFYSLVLRGRFGRGQRSRTYIARAVSVCHCPVHCRSAHARRRRDGRGRGAVAQSATATHRHLQRVVGPRRRRTHGRWAGASRLARLPPGHHHGQLVTRSSITRCLHCTAGCTTGCMITAGCTTGWVNYANEPSQAALELSSQDAYDVIALTRSKAAVDSRRCGAFDQCRVVAPSLWSARRPGTRYQTTYQIRHVPLTVFTAARKLLCFFLRVGDLRSVFGPTVNSSQVK